MDNALENWKVGGRYFYFKSLLDKPSPFKEIGQAGASALNASSSNGIALLGNLENGKKDDSSLINQTLQFLQTMIVAERAQEVAYFTDKFKKLKEKQVSSKITNFFSNPDNFNYQDFIIAINTMYSDINSFKKTVEIEKKRLEEVDKVLRVFDDWKEKNENQYDHALARSQNIRHWIFDTLKSEFNDDSAVTKTQLYNYLNTKTIGNDIQKRFSTIFSKVWKSNITQERLQQLIESGELKNTDSAKKALVSQLVLDFMTTATSTIVANVSQLQDEFSQRIQEADNQKIKKFFSQNDRKAQEIVNTFFSASGNASEEAKKTLKYYLNALSNFESDDPLDRMVSRIFNERYHVVYNDESKRINGLTSKLVIELNKMLDKMKVQPGTKDDQGGLVTRIKEYLRSCDIKAKRPQVKIDNERVTNFINQLLENADLLQIKIAKKDNLISEAYFANNSRQLAQAVGDLIISTLTTDGQKIDTSALEIAKIELLPQYEHVEKILFSTMNEIIINSTKISREPIEVGNGNLKIFNEQEWRQKNGFGEGEFSIEAETLRRQFVKEKAIQRVTNVLEDAQEIEQVLKAIESSISIGATVKSYDKYDNELGFHGGSIGGDVESQLKNITKMLDYGGVTIEDSDWLSMAVYNAGPNLLGSHLKNPLEAIFSAMGAMLLFDDAGSQAQYIMSLAPDQIEHTTPQFIHLYHLNNLYIPSSYVLQKTYEAMKEVVNDLTSSMKTSGVKATINNNVSEEPGEIDFNAFFNAHKGEVTITLTFLAGFLDLVNSINNAIN